MLNYVTGAVAVASVAKRQLVNNFGNPEDGEPPVHDLPLWAILTVLINFVVFLPVLLVVSTEPRAPSRDIRSETQADTRLADWLYLQPALPDPGHG